MWVQVPPPAQFRTNSPEFLTDLNVSAHDVQDSSNSSVEFGALAVEVLLQQTALNKDIFRAYDIRGIADRDLTDDVVYRIALAFGTTLRQLGKIRLPSAEIFARVRCAFEAPLSKELQKQA